MGLDIDHLTATVSDRGLRYLPAIPATYENGTAEVYESSSAEQPSIWLKATTVPESPKLGASVHLHLTAENARRLGEQLLALSEQIDPQPMLRAERTPNL
jgi:hypothetical protein